MKILVTFATPLITGEDQSRVIRNSPEVVAIQDSIRKSRFRSLIKVVPFGDVTRIKMNEEILLESPNLLHFIGHANSIGGLGAINDDFEPDIISPQEFVDIISNFKSIDVVILSACYTDQLAERILEKTHVKSVIGVDGAIGENDTKNFSTIFYLSIGQGNGIGESFETARGSLNEQRSKLIKIHFKPGINSHNFHIFPTPVKKLHDYLEDVIKYGVTSSTKFNYGSTEFRLMDDRNAVLLPLHKNWNTETTEIETKFRDTITSAKEIFDSFMANQEEKYLIVGAPFGIGKTTLINELGGAIARFAISGDGDAYIPILVADVNGTYNYNLGDVSYGGITLEEHIKNILDVNDENIKVLFIFDGIDEHVDGLRFFLSLLRSEPFTNYRNRKIILTSRLVPEFPESYGGNNDTLYMRLLPFSTSQVDDYLKGRTNLTYQSAIYLGIDGEDVRNPLLVSLLIEVYLRNESDLSNIAKQVKLSQYEYRAFIYLNFIHGLLQGKQFESVIQLEKIVEEKRILRRMALLINLFESNLSYRLLTDNDEFSGFFSNLFGLDKKEYRKRISSVLYDYFQLPLHSNNYDRTVLFYHSAFKEYLMAENYIEIFLNKNKKYDLDPSWMNVTIPTKESLQFLEGLLGLIEKRKKSTILNKWIDESGENKVSLFNSMDITVRGDPMELIINRACSLFDVEDIPALIDTIDLEDLTEVRGFKFAYGKNYFIQHGQRKTNFSINNYKNLWIKRWLSLFVFNILDHNRFRTELDKQKLGNLIVESSHLVPSYMKRLRYADLAGLVLRGVKLSGADLTFADLKDTDLSGSNLVKTKLINSHLCGCILNGANLTQSVLINSIMYKTQLVGAILFDSSLSKCHIKEAQLVGAQLNNANFYDAEFVDSNVSYSTAYHAKFDKANLSRSAFRFSNLGRASFTDTIMDQTKLYGACITETVLSTNQSATLDRSLSG